MKLKKVLAVSLAAAMTLSMAACGRNEGTSSTDSNAAPSTETGSASNTGSDASADGELSYAGIVLGAGQGDPSDSDRSGCPPDNITLPHLPENKAWKK